MSIAHPLPLVPALLLAAMVGASVYAPEPWDMAGTAGAALAAAWLILTVAIRSHKHG